MICHVCVPRYINGEFYVIGGESQNCDNPDKTDQGVISREHAPFPPGTRHEWSVFLPRPLHKSVGPSFGP